MYAAALVIFTIKWGWDAASIVRLIRKRGIVVINSRASDGQG